MQSRNELIDRLSATAEKCKRVSEEALSEYRRNFTLGETALDREIKKKQNS